MENRNQQYLNSMYRLSTLLLALLLQTPIFCQDIEVKYEVNSETKEVVFSYEKNYVGSITVNLKLTQLTNTFSEKNVISVAKGDKGILLTLKPIDSKKNIRFTYTYSSFRGALIRRIKEYNDYLLPYPEGREAKLEKELNDLKEVERMLGLTGTDRELMELNSPDNYYSLKFDLEMHASVTACRGGIVIKVVDDVNTNAEKIISLRQNKVEIEHKDGSVGRYRGFAQGGILVKEGESIYPGKRLGKVGNQRLSTGFYYSLFYIKDINFETGSKASPTQSKVSYEYLTPRFIHAKGSDYLQEGKSYQSIHPQELIIQEMTRKERKRFIKQREDK